MDPDLVLPLTLTLASFAVGFGLFAVLRRADARLAPGKHLLLNAAVCLYLAYQTIQHVRDGDAAWAALCAAAATMAVGSILHRMCPAQD